MKSGDKIQGRICGKRLNMMLNSAIEKEITNWKPAHFIKLNGDNSEVGHQERDETVAWLISLNDRFKFNPETVVLCIALFDYILCTLKVKRKYIQCIAVSSYFIAAKTLEEDEVIPTTDQLVSGTMCDCRVSDILRMEKVILQKLQWNAKLVTSLDFLHIMHGLLLLNHMPLRWAPGKQLSILSKKLISCLANHRLMIFKPSTLTLALLSLELQQCTRDWLALTIMMQRLIKLENGDLIHCRERISEHLAIKFPTRLRLVDAASKGRSNRISTSKPSKRKVEQIEVDDIYDSIKRLYAEDVQGTNCATQAEQLIRSAKVAIGPSLMPITAT